MRTRQTVRPFEPVAIDFADIGQAAPAVGLIVLLTMWLGTGFRTAVAGLVVYAILPILQNTIVGIDQVDKRTMKRRAESASPGYARSCRSSCRSQFR